MRLLMVFSLILMSLNAHSACSSLNDSKDSFVNMWEIRTLSGQESWIKCASESWYYFENKAKVQDSEFRYKMSSYLMSALHFNPDNFFVVMENEGYLFDKWLRYIPNRMFTWYNDGECGYNPEIIQLKKLIEGVDLETKKLKSYKDFASTLQSVSCFVVD
ncbi:MULTISPECIES: hypothetical protein [Pseudoalteromonas]|uniref:hypothetical protein n=1 Tax=Pseudoalteromonas TaxID=53246 RepID=UPI0007C463B2|nr:MULTISPECIES: hypothetical protein [Pseudoalteromonas]TMO31195.1 hypothetical protein CWC28_01790 [Pseudoalteromonas sp. S4492]